MTIEFVNGNSSKDLLERLQYGGKRYSETLLPTECYLVYVPSKNRGMRIDWITINKEDAINHAKSIKDKYLKRGWKSWAEKVKVKQPNNPTFCYEKAHELMEHANLCDMARDWANNSIYQRASNLLWYFGKYLEVKQS